MNKIYQILLILLLFVLLVLNIVFFAYDSKLISYFEPEDDMRTPQEIILSLEEEDVSTDFFDLSIVEEDKFKELKDFEVDLDDPSLLDDLISEDDEDDTASDTDLEFETGNPNPFLPRF